MVFALAGVCYAIGAILLVARLGIGETATGYNLMFMSIASVVVGGTALWGGSGGALNTFIGVLIVQVIGNGMVVIGFTKLHSRWCVRSHCYCCSVLVHRSKNSRFR